MVAVVNTEPELSRDSKLVVAAKTFVCGGVAGCCAKTCVAPLDRVKILLQTHNKHYRNLGVFSTLKQVVIKEGVTGLYQGNGVQMIRIFPYAALQYLTYEQSKKVAKNLPVLNHSPNLAKLLCGSVAGLTAVVVTYPLDLIRARLAFQVQGEAVYQGIMHVVRSIRHLEGGVRGLYQGITPTLLGMAPYAGLSFCSFEFLKNLALDTFPNIFGKPCPQNTGGLVLTLPAKLMCGGLAGAIAQTVAYPLDVTRRNMQISGMIKRPDPLSPRRKWQEVMMKTYRDKGLTKGLYRGLSVNYIRIMPSVAISFATYESVKQFLGLDTGVDR